MANYTTTAVQCAGIERNNPDSNLHGAALYRLLGTRFTALVSFGIAPSFEKQVIGSTATISFYVNAPAACTLAICTLWGRFDEATVTSSTARVGDVLGTVNVPRGNGVQVSAVVNLPDIDVFKYGIEVRQTSSVQEVYLYGRADTATRPGVSFSAEPFKPNYLPSNPGRGAFLDAGKANHFTIITTSQTREDESRCITVPPFSKIEIRWRVAGEIAYTTAIFTQPALSTQGMLFPAGTFPATKPLQWQLQCTTDQGVVGDWSPWESFTTADSLSTAVPVSPVSKYLVGNEDNTFIWRHVIATGTIQTAAQLEWSADGAAWQTLLAHQGAVQQAVIPAGTISGSARYWRVRTANLDGAWGAWSDPAPILVQAAPAAPSIEMPEGAPRVTLRWQSQEQQAYEVGADDWHSGPQHGTAKVYSFSQWFADGVHHLRVRVQSALGLWSPWAEVAVTVRNQPQAPVTLSAWTVPNGVRLQWDGDHPAYTLYRDGKPIHSTTGHDYTDYFAAGKCSYTVRAIVGRYYAMSGRVVGIPDNTGAVSAADNIQWIPLKFRRGGKPTRAGSVSREIALQDFVGRSLPVAEVSPWQRRQHTLDYSLRDPAQLAAIQALVGKTVLCKQPGAAVVGVLGPVEHSGDWAGVDITLTVTETDYKEGGGGEDIQ